MPQWDGFYKKQLLMNSVLLGTIIMSLNDSQRDFCCLPSEATKSVQESTLLPQLWRWRPQDLSKLP